MEKPSLEIGNSNWAIKEGELLGYNRVGNDYLPIPITMTRASLGTRVNPEGLVEDVELLGSEEVTNGDFSSGTTGWTEIGDFAISGGKASITSASQYSQLTSQQGTNFLTSGKQYKLQVDIETLSISGVFAYRVTGGAVTPILTSDLVDGVYTTYFTMISDGYIWFQTTGSYTGLNVTIDNVSVKEATIDNLARVDYDGTASSLLVEPQRTNLIKYSESFDSWYAKNYVTVAENTSETISPSGNNTASKITINSVSTVRRLYELISASSGSDYTFTLYAKKGTTDFIKLFFTSSIIDAEFNLTNGTVTSGTGSIESVGNDWYRLQATGTSSLTGEVPQIQLSSSASVSDYLYVWGCQVEQGSYATSYIPNFGTALGVTRVQDQYEKTGISNLINSEEGVLFVEMAAFSESNLNSYITIGQNTSNGILGISFYTGSNNILLDHWEGASETYHIESISDITEFNKIAICYNGTSIKGYINGSPVWNTTVTAWSSNALSELNFAFGNSGTNKFSGKVKQLQVFKTALTDTELATLTQ